MQSNRISFKPGQACDLEGTDVLLPELVLGIQSFLADKVYDANERVLKLLDDAGVETVIPPKSNRKNPREYDAELYKARHLIENFFGETQTVPGNCNPL